MELQLHLKLLSDATFGRGDGIAGLVDAEVEHDPHGFPYLHSRTLKGLLVEEAANVLYALARFQPPFPPATLGDFDKAAKTLFGEPGSNSEEQGTLYPGHAELPEQLRKAVEVELQRDRLDPAQVLESLTATRRQTAMEADGVPSQGSLRAMRVVLRETPFVARLDVYPDPDEVQQAVLAASVLGLRRAGTGRNRGRGRLSVTLSEGGHDVTASWFQRFQTLLGGSVA